MEILAEVGIKVNYKKARELFREAGVEVDEATFAVKIPERLIRWAVDQVPKQFSLFGIDAEFHLDIGPDQTASANGRAMASFAPASGWKAPMI